MVLLALPVLCPWESNMQTSMEQFCSQASIRSLQNRFVALFALAVYNHWRMAWTLESWDAMSSQSSYQYFVHEIVSQPILVLKIMTLNLFLRQITQNLQRYLKRTLFSTFIKGILFPISFSFDEKKDLFFFSLFIHSEMQIG